MMTRTEAASAVYFLSQLAPRSAQDQQELLQVIKSLTAYCNNSNNVYNERGTIPVG